MPEKGIGLDFALKGADILISLPHFGHTSRRGNTLVSQCGQISPINV